MLGWRRTFSGPPQSVSESERRSRLGAVALSSVARLPACRRSGSAAPHTAGPESRSEIHVDSKPGGPARRRRGERQRHDRTQAAARRLPATSRSTGERLQARSVPSEVELVILGPTKEQRERLDALRALRAGLLSRVNPSVRLLWVNASEQAAEVLRAFEAGVCVLLRRHMSYPAGLLSFGELQIDTAGRWAQYASTPLLLRRLEYELLIHLARNPHRVHGTSELLREVWGYRSAAATRTVDSHVRRLRRALRSTGAEGLLANVRGVGYRLAPDGQIEHSDRTAKLAGQRGDRALPILARWRVQSGRDTARTRAGRHARRRPMSATTAPQPVTHQSAPANLGGYVAIDGEPRELVAVPAGAATTLVVDRLADTRADDRLIAHLAADEPPENARLVCALYLADDTRGRCRRVTSEDFAPTTSRPTRQPRPLEDDKADDGPLCNRAGRCYRLREVSDDGALSSLRWICFPDSASEDDDFKILTLREVIGRLERYEPIRTMTVDALAQHGENSDLSTCQLRDELTRVLASPIVLNRRLREAVEREVGYGVSLSVIASRCKRVKREARGHISGDTSWLARRIGQMPEGGRRTTPWIHSDTLALIAREGLCRDPRELEAA
jgi:DNA-binding winged helix-turn-helix (wHTH) protein